MRRVAIAALAILAPTYASALELEGAVRYSCTVSEKAGVSAVHLEGADAPKAFVEPELPTRFMIEIHERGEGSDRYQLTELAYDGEDRDPYEYHTGNSVLHSVYTGDGRQFASTDDQSFFVLNETVHQNDDGSLAFFHAGWEYPGGEDTTLAVRWGRCKVVD